MRNATVALLSSALAIGGALAQSPSTQPSPPPAAAPAAAAWHDLADHLAGTWSLTGDVMGHAAHHTVRAEWVLNRQFLRIEERTSSDAPADERRYDSIWFLGYDDTSDRYVMHLMDTFGGRFSETLGYGTREGNALHFVFEYPDGPFHTDFIWDPAKQTWTWLMQQKNKSGQWTKFATLTLTKAQ